MGGNAPEPNVLRNCLSFQDGLAVSNLTGLVQDHNSWNNIPASASSFASTDTTGVTAQRQADGSLSVSSFLRLSPGSNQIDKGIDVGIPFSGSAPDLGAYEITSSTPPPVFKNVAQSKAFIKACTSGTGSSVVYAVPAGKYTASTQAGADQLATNDINNNGQNYANINGICSPKTIIKVVITYSDGSTVTQQ